MASGPSLVGSVFERTVSSKPSSPFASGPSKTGFPQVQHRSKKSAFARARETSASPRDHVPTIAQSSSVAARKSPVGEADDWRAQMDRENRLRVDAMTDAEREEERREILARFGPGISDVLKKVRGAREKTTDNLLVFTTSDLPAPAPAPTTSELPNESNISHGLEEAVPVDSSPRSSSPAPRGPLPPALSNSQLSSPTGTRPASRASRKLRFAELTPDDVHVYESAPPSPRKQAMLALLPPSADVDADAVSLGEWKGATNLPDPSSAPAPTAAEPEEGTPEYIRRRFFPSAPAYNPDLAWMQEPFSSTTVTAGPAPNSLRFDLTGTPLAAPLHVALPTHLGLHHHAPDADGVQRAGYTLDDVFLMSRSGVRAQRAAGMRMLVGVARWVKGVKGAENEDAEPALSAAELTDLKKRVIAAGVDAMGERGALGVHAIEVAYECVAGWTTTTIGSDDGLNGNGEDKTGTEMEGVEMGDSSGVSFPLEHLLPQLVVALSTHAPLADSASSASLGRLLAILRRLAHQTNDIAAQIVSTPSLISTILRTFLLNSTSSWTADAITALDLLTALALSSRVNAQALVAPADALLRFVATLPPPDSALLAGSLRFYKALATYGMYAHIAGTAHLQFAALADYVLGADGGSDRVLMRDWAELLEAWVVCATDPHQTTPDHEILWSQVVAWGWAQDVLALRERLSVEPADFEVWAAAWRAEAAWLAGARVNGVRGGEAERAECVGALKSTFEAEEGKEHQVVKSALIAFAEGLASVGQGGSSKLKGLGRAAEVLTAVVRLWLACLPPATDGPLTSPPFSLPFAQLSEICAKLVTHSLWSHLPTCGPEYVLFRPLAGLLAGYLRLSRRLPDVSHDVWMAQALSILSRLLPGDEELASQVTQDILDLITPQWATARGLNIPQIFWDKGGMSVIKPFLARAVQPRDDIHIGPACMSPHSIKCAMTQRLPAPTSAFTSRDYGLPLPRDWTLSPLDHLLRSGTSAVFNDLPPSWDASEVDVTRAALLLTKISREVSSRFSFVDFVLTREEVVLGCMKVFMLEHGQAQSDSAEEIFRDHIVGQLMVDILAPFTTAAASPSGTSTQPDLEQVGVRFLGTGTPFYQYYTDFVALYDAISFSHPTFARLLLPPTSMRYAPDYRRLLWNDFGHLLKTIRTSPADIVAADLAEYLWPVETDAQMLGAYLRALIKVPMQGFLRVVAMHHVACSIWPDLRESTADVPGQDRAEKLLKAIVDQGGLEVVADVLRYRQGQEGQVRVPPECYQLSGELKAARLEYVERVGGDDFARRVRGLLQ
ncbi:hypothetical protein C8R43DRAFT_1231178 [Mycena crocata]|nr:hypothetical protein C8R43DRAFT_1231178 [Mycena crocata]